MCPPDVGSAWLLASSRRKGNTVEKVRISIKSKNPMYSTTNINGGFQVEEVPFGYDYTLVPEKNDDLMNRISTIDLIRLSKHILGCSLLLRLTNGLPPIWTNQVRSLRWT
ncbi:MAG: hypothetical protein IPH16_17845 [Haliscomenobacter sp.]|nr:hypothetical protein [Haliscomenobacter sp.]